MQMSIPTAESRAFRLFKTESSAACSSLNCFETRNAHHRESKSGLDRKEESVVLHTTCNRNVFTNHAK